MCTNSKRRAITDFNECSAKNAHDTIIVVTLALFTILFYKENKINISVKVQPVYTDFSQEGNEGLTGEDVQSGVNANG